VVGLASSFRTGIQTISLGTDAGNEYDAARLVAEHVGTDHHEIFESSETVVTRLPWAIAAAEITDPDVIEYLLPLVALYQQLAEPRRIITGYGADIPLGGMYRTVADLHQIDELIVADLAGVDGLNEMSPLLSGLAGHWSTHPFWDRNVLDILLSAEPGLKRRNDMDKWILRESVRDLLPQLTVNRPKLGVHEGSGTTSTWTLMLEKFGAPAERIGALKQQVSEAIYDLVVVQGVDPDQVATLEVMADCVRADSDVVEVSA
jgi:(carboxyethyl)arginine beta-lactam-synthase